MQEQENQPFNFWYIVGKWSFYKNKIIPLKLNQMKTNQLLSTFKLTAGNIVKCTRVTISLAGALFMFIAPAKADYTIASGSNVNASTLTGQSGTLTINGTLTVSSNVSLLNFTTVIINGPDGQIYWSNNSDLTFIGSVSITLNNNAQGLQPTGGNASKRLIVGSTIIAVSNDNSNNAAFSFEDFNGAGGLPQFIMSTSVSAICSNSSFTATITPLNDALSYKCAWAISGTGTASPSSHTNFNSPQTTTITPTGTGTYTISCTLYKADDGDPIVTKTKTVTVNAVPATPTATTATPAAICIGSSASIKATSAGNTIQWYTVNTGGTAIGTSASGASFSVMPSSSTTYYAEAKTAAGCVSTRSSATVTVNLASVGGSVTGNSNVCSGSNSSTLTLSGHTGSVTRWESSLNNFATVDATINNTSNSLTITNLSTTTYYRALVTSGACTATYSSVAVLTVSNPGTWLGVNTDWNSSLNWCNGSIPSASTNVTIPNGLSFYPVITGTALANNVTVAAGGSASIIVTGTLKVAGSFTSTYGINATAGTIEFIGTNNQSVRADNFVSGTISNLKVSNTVAAASAANPSVAVNAAGGMLKISGAVSFGSLDNAFLQTNDNLTLLSSATSTASVGDITNNDLNSGNNIVGKIVIERYIPGKRAWRLLTAPVTAASQVKMSDSWQEGAARVTNPSIISAASNPNPGYGVHITYGNPAANGYDQGPNGNSSIFYLTTTGWNGVPSGTNGTTFNAGYITDQPAYMLFVRGDRSTQLSSGTGAAVTSTTLRMKGNINTGSMNLNLGTSIASGSSKFRLIGNPYPSALNFHKIITNSSNAGAGFADAFYLWDASITGSNGVGGWVAMSYNNATASYDRNVVSTGINSSGDIQSGAGFLIDYSGTATTLEVKESNKVTGSNSSLFRPVSQVNQLRVTLLAKNADNTVSVNDGLLVNYDDTYNSAVDNADMKKVANFAENFAIVNEGTSLVIEKRKLFTEADSIHFKMTKMKQKNYQLEFTLDNMNAPVGTTAILEDKFLGSKTVLNLKATNKYDFAINTNPASGNAERFNLAFKRAAEFSDIKAALKEKNVVIDWTMNGEFNLVQYEIERSLDGTNFSAEGTVLSNGDTTAQVNYNWTDLAPLPGNYTYRVKAVTKNGVAVYSNSVTIKIVNNKQGMYVFPNPVTGNNVQLQMNEITEGTYNAKLTSLSGELITNAVIQYKGGAATQTIGLPSQTAAGIYLLQISDDKGKTNTLKVLVSRN